MSGVDPRPFVKWAGGKTQLLPELLARVPSNFNKYVELFVGGGALFWAVSGRYKSAVLVDSNPDLMAVYKAIRDDVGRVIVQLRKMQADHCEEHYYRVRASDPRELCTVKRAARMIYLNKTCFNGLYRVNKKGLFNVPIGLNFPNRPIRGILDEDNLRACSQLLAGATLICGSFCECDSLIKEGDFVYMDPPYISTGSKTSSFVSFTVDGFDHSKQVRLAKFARNLKGRGVSVLLSNSGTEETRKIYESVGGFTIDVVRARRCINSMGNRRGKVEEFLIG